MTKHNDSFIIHDGEIINPDDLLVPTLCVNAIKLSSERVHPECQNEILAQC